MDRKNINVIGAGGHAKVVIEIAELLDFEIDGIYDDNPSVDNILDYKVNLAIILMLMLILYWQWEVILRENKNQK